LQKASTFIVSPLSCLFYTYSIYYITLCCYLLFTENQFTRRAFDHSKNHTHRYRSFKPLFVYLVNDLCCIIYNIALNIYLCIIAWSRSKDANIFLSSRLFYYTTQSPCDYYLLFITNKNYISYIHIYDTPNLWNCRLHEIGRKISDFMKSATLLPTTRNQQLCHQIYKIGKFWLLISWNRHTFFCRMHEFGNTLQIVIPI